jgi:hypothetical protein
VCVSVAVFFFNLGKRTARHGYFRLRLALCLSSPSPARMKHNLWPVRTDVPKSHTHNTYEQGQGQPAMSSLEGAGREGSGREERRTWRNNLGRRCRGLRPDGQPCGVLLENRNSYDYCTIFHKTEYNREQVR